MDSSGMGQDNMEVNVSNSAEESSMVYSGDSDIEITTTISGLDPFINYTFYVLAVTIAPSEPSDSVTVQTSEGGNV